MQTMLEAEKVGRKVLAVRSSEVVRLTVPPSDAETVIEVTLLPYLMQGCTRTQVEVRRHHDKRRVAFAAPVRVGISDPVAVKE